MVVLLRQVMALARVSPQHLPCRIVLVLAEAEDPLFWMLAEGEEQKGQEMHLNVHQGAEEEEEVPVRHDHSQQEGEVAAEEELLVVGC